MANKYKGFFEVDAYITSFYGWRTSPITGKKELHDGVDIATGLNWNMHVPTMSNNVGIKVRVTRNRTDPSGAKYVAFKDISNAAPAPTFWEFHINDAIVKEGQVLTAQAYIGKTGNTGNSTGAHTHLCIEINGKRVDPLPYLDTYIKDGKTYVRGWSPLPEPITCEQKLQQLQKELDDVKLELEKSKVAYAELEKKNNEAIKILQG